MAVQSLSAGNALKQLVTLVGGSSSGFSGVIAAYVTTFTVTIVVSAICLCLAFAMYGIRTDQKLRRDLRYGGRVYVVTGTPAELASVPSQKLLMYQCDGSNSSTNDCTHSTATRVM